MDRHLPLDNACLKVVGFGNQVAHPAYQLELSIVCRLYAFTALSSLTLVLDAYINQAKTGSSAFVP